MRVRKTIPTYTLDPFPLQNTLAQPLVCAENGIPYEFTIASQKENGGGFPSAVSVLSSSGAQVPAELEENGNNYTVKFTPTEDGEFVAQVTFTVTASLKLNVATMGTDFSFVVLTSFFQFLTPCNVLLMDLVLKEESNTRKVFSPLKLATSWAKRFLLVDTPSLPRSRVQPFQFVANCVVGPFGEDVPVTIVDNNDGTATATYVPVAPGDHIVEVKLHDTNIKDSPFKVPIDYSSESMSLVVATSLIHFSCSCWKQLG